MARKPLGTLGDFNRAFMNETGWDSTDWTKARYLGKEIANEEIDEGRLLSKLGRYPTLVRAFDAAGKLPINHQAAQKRLGMERDTSSHMAELGGAAGTLASDIRDDGLRSFWWLFNAIPATSSLAAEAIYRTAAKRFDPEKKGFQGAAVNISLINPETRKMEKIDIKTDQGKQQALDLGLATNINPKTAQAEDGIDHFALKADVQSTRGNLSMRGTKGGHLAAMTLPQAAVINTALGLMSPFGGTGGYAAALPSEEDPTKTSNVVAEVAAKYFLSRTGGLLPYDEFVKHRPDVSRGEYNKYKAFKYDKKADFDLSDGDITLPTGVLKYTNEGIHGPEIQFLGKSLPVTTGVLPYLGTLVGGVAAAGRRRHLHNRSVDINPEFGHVIQPEQYQKLLKAGRIQDPVKREKAAQKATGYYDRNVYLTHLARDMFLGSAAGGIAGMAVGNLLEGERRRRNQLANNPNNVDVGF